MDADSERLIVSLLLLVAFLQSLLLLQGGLQLGGLLSLLFVSIALVVLVGVSVFSVWRVTA